LHLFLKRGTQATLRFLGSYVRRMMMGRVYNNERDLPDDPNRVGDEDYGRKWWLDEPDPDVGREEDWDDARDND
jgi:hypothetical protein